MKRMIFATILAIAAFLSSAAEAQQVGAGCTPIGRGATNAFFSDCTIATGTANDIILTPTFGNTPSTAQLAKFSSFRFQATATNTGAVTVRIGVAGPGPYNVYKGGPLGPSPLVGDGSEIVVGNIYSLSFDPTLNSSVGGWWLTGQRSGAVVAANCAPYIPFNSPFQSGFDPNVNGGASGGSGIFPNAGGPQVACLTGNGEFKLDNVYFTSIDPSGVNQPAGWKISAVTLGASGRARLTLVNAGLFNTVTISIASPAVVSLTAHGLSAGDRISFSTTGALPTGITAGTVYYVIAAGLTANAFEFSATSGGSAVNTSGSQSGVQTLSSSILTGDNLGVSNSYNSDRTPSNINGYWLVTKIDATHVDLNAVSYDSTKTYSTAVRTGFMSNGALDTNPFAALDRIVLGRNPQFNDSIGTFLTQSQVAPTSGAVQPYTGISTWIADPDATTEHAQGLITFNVMSTLDGTTDTRGFYPAFGGMRGLVGFDALRFCGGGLDGNTQAGLLRCDKGFGTISSNIGYWSYNQPIGQPLPDQTKGLKIVNTPGFETTKIDIYVDTFTLQGPLVGASGPNTLTQYQTTTKHSGINTVYQRIETGTTGINGMRAADFPLAAGTSYYVLLLVGYDDGAGGAFLTTNLDPTTWGLATNYQSGFYSVVGQVKTKPGSATFDTYLIENGIAQHTISGNETLSAIHCSPQSTRTQVLAGGAANNTITVGVVGNYSDNCAIYIINTDTANTKTLNVNGLASFTMSPSQSVLVQRAGAIWTENQLLPMSNPVVGTQACTDSSTKAASTAFVAGCLSKFSAVASADQSPTVNAFSQVLFPFTEFNVGSAYSTGTSLFTAPIAGYYEFGCRTAIHTGADYVTMTFFKNGSQLTNTVSRQYVSSADGTAGQITTILQLAANDTIGCYINIHTSGTVYGNTLTPQFWGTQVW